MQNDTSSELLGKTFLVTGASSGIGLQTARLIADQGGSIILLARDAERLSQAKESLKGPCHYTRAVDLNDDKVVVSVLKDIKKQTGGVDGIIHSAGCHLTMPLQFVTPSDVAKLVGTNFQSAANLTAASLKYNLLKNKSSIVFLSSVVAQVGQPAVSIYAATKGALEAFSKSLAIELANRSIRVNCVAAGLVKTPLTDGLLRKMSSEKVEAIEKMHPLGIGEPAFVANAIFFLLQNPWITGTTVVVDGGYTAH